MKEGQQWNSRMLGVNPSSFVSLEREDSLVHIGLRISDICSLG